MTKLSLNKAAKEAGIAKSTLLEAIRNSRMSAPKNEKGHYEIDPSELFRVFPKSSSTEQIEPKSTTLENHSSTSGLQVEVKMLGEALEKEQAERARERESYEERLEKAAADREELRADYKQTLAMLTDQRPKGGATEKLEAELASLREQMGEMRRPLISWPFGRKKVG